MKKVQYIDYFLDRLRFRKIPQAVAERVLCEATERYFDVETGRFIAIKEVQYGRRKKRLMVAYEEQGNEVTPITVHAVTKRQVQSKIERLRWIPK
jgi:hypothetical protein